MRYLAVMALLLLSSLAAVHASVVDNWVICPSCTTDAQFQAAARSWYGSQQVRTQVNVGNPNTGKVYQMWLQGSGGGTPLRIASSGAIVASERPLVISSEDAEAAMAQSLAVQPVVSDYIESTQQEPAFGSMVAAHGNHVLFNVSSADLQSEVFASYANAIGGMEQVCPRVWAEEDAVNPGFSSKMMSGTSGMALALKSYFGHGIMVSPVFGNGDVATFQINPLAPSACDYVKGSAKDRYGNALPDTTPNVGGGSSSSVVVGSGGGANPAGGSYSVGGEAWLICSYIGGQLSGCYVTHIQP
ncbi:hypothetical protein [Frateuria defendens]|uniref:hypothetical protein n=1 Tax=Frateuria defendens TaxID=2219559 RepID=UPI001293B0AB|nr:hypothetical protein [Frateuria defendens]